MIAYTVSRVFVSRSDPSQMPVAQCGAACVFGCRSNLILRANETSCHWKVCAPIKIGNRWTLQRVQMQRQSLMLPPL